MAHREVIGNTKAYYDYHVESTLVAGMALTSPDVKAIRSAHFRLTGNHVVMTNLGLDAVGLSGGVEGPKRLLVNAKELADAAKWLQSAGNTIVVLAILENERGLFKAKLGFVRGKKQHDKRESIKQRDVERDMRRQDNG